jgi:hypothetical protein
MSGVVNVEIEEEVHSANVQLALPPESPDDAGSARSQGQCERTSNCGGFSVNSIVIVEGPSLISSLAFEPIESFRSHRSDVHDTCIWTAVVEPQGGSKTVVVARLTSSCTCVRLYNGGRDSVIHVSSWAKIRNCG